MWLEKFVHLFYRVYDKNQSTNVLYSVKFVLHVQEKAACN